LTGRVKGQGLGKLGCPLVSSTRCPCASCGRIPLLLSVPLSSVRVKPLTRQNACPLLLLPAPFPAVAPSGLRVACADGGPVDAPPASARPTRSGHVGSPPPQRSGSPRAAWPVHRGSTAAAHRDRLAS